MLQSRSRAPNLRAELFEFREFTRLLVDDPLLALRHLLKVARHLCNAGSASVSLLRNDAEGRQIVSWDVMSGALAAYEGIGLRQCSSPCGLCLCEGTTILVSRPARAYKELRDTQPAILENLIVPLYDNAGKPLGTLWAAHHDAQSHFGSDDARIVEQLAVQAVLAIQLLEVARERRSAESLLESYHRAQYGLFEHDLYRERSLREHAEASAEEVRRSLQLKDAAVQETHHRVKNTLQVAAGVLSLHQRATDSSQARLALQRSHGCLQLLAKAHELLCLGVGCPQSIFMPALLDTLSNALRHSFAAMAHRVQLVIVTEPLRLPADAAIAVAMLANEALSNAYKHAFPNDARGEIAISLRFTSDETLTLRIADDGIGMPKVTTERVGLELVRAFAAQLSGVLTCFARTDTSGTVITLTMPKPAELGRSDIDRSDRADQALLAV